MKFSENIILFFIIFISSCASSQDRKDTSTTNSQNGKDTSITNSQDKKESYDDLKKRVLITRDDFFVKYSSADSINQKLVLDSARRFIFETITQNIFSHWFGTPWEFYGQSRTPQKGTIACGYFATGVLSDVGFGIPRVKWAQSASEVFIKRLSREIKRFHNRPISEVVEYIKKRENGLYIVGLDCHVGFIYKNNDSIKFVHSSYYQPSIGVMAEDLDSWNPLRDSKYRVLGRILDDSMIISWINGKRIE
jgi:hypothetical protein